VLVIETTDGEKHEYEIVGLVEDDEGNGYAVGYSEKADEFVVADNAGKLLDNDELAQEILDDFFVLAEETAPTEDESESAGDERKNTGVLPDIQIADRPLKTTN
jgi:hypothetical protein